MLTFEQSEIEYLELNRTEGGNARLQIRTKDGSRFDLPVKGDCAVLAGAREAVAEFFNPDKPRHAIRFGPSKDFEEINKNLASLQAQIAKHFDAPAHS